jgi:hypothetical protein
MTTPEPDDAETVYVSRHGHTYHSEGCPSLTRYDAKQRDKHFPKTLGEAKGLKLRPCRQCRPEA